MNPHEVKLLSCSDMISRDGSRKKEHGLMSQDVKVLSAVYWHMILPRSILCLDRRLVGVVPLLLLADRVIRKKQISRHVCQLEEE